MMRYDDAALSQRRDAAPLRLISWLTFSLPYALQDFVEILMTFYGKRDPEPADRLQEYLTQHCPQCSIREHLDVIRNHIVDQIRDWNQDWQPKCLLDLSFRLHGINSARELSTQQSLWHPSYMVLEENSLQRFELRPHGIWEVLAGDVPFCFRIQCFPDTSMWVFYRDFSLR